MDLGIDQEGESTYLFRSPPEMGSAPACFQIPQISTTTKPDHISRALCPYTSSDSAEDFDSPAPANLGLGHDRSTRHTEKPLLLSRVQCTLTPGRRQEALLRRHPRSRPADPRGGLGPRRRKISGAACFSGARHSPLLTLSPTLRVAGPGSMSPSVFE